MDVNRYAQPTFPGDQWHPDLVRLELVEPARLDVDLGPKQRANQTISPRTRETNWRIVECSIAIERYSRMPRAKASNVSTTAFHLVRFQVPFARIIHRTVYLARRAVATEGRTFRGLLFKATG